MNRQNSRKLLTAAGLSLAAIPALAQDAAETTGVTNPFPESIVALPLAGMAFILIVIALALYFANQREKRRQELLSRFVEHGQEIPIALLPLPPSRQRELSRGVWLLAWGIGVGAALYFSSGEWGNAAWALILLLLSAASFVNAALFSPRAGAAADAR